MSNIRGHLGLKIFQFIFRFLPMNLFYNSSFNRKVFYRAFYICLFCYGIGLWRRPYIARAILKKQQQQKAVQQQELSETLSSLDIRLSSFGETYFVIIAGSCALGKQEELAQKQRIAFELNNQINKRLDINGNYFGDVKFLFIGTKEIYDLLEADRTVVEFYEKEAGRSEGSMIYIFAREEDSQRLISAIPFKSDLTSIIRIISKHKARKFASSVQF